MLDRITETLLKRFSEENDLQALPEDKRFEHFAAFSVIRRHFSRSFATSDVVVGGGGDTGIDALAIIVNNVLVTDVDVLHELAAQNEYVEPTFVFVQSETSASFNAAKIGNFAYGVVDFFSENPKLPRGEDIKALSEVTDVIISQYAAILRSPKCFLYYVTTGTWQDDQNLVARRDSAIDDLRALNIFKAPEMLCVGATDLHQAYQKTKSPITRTFVFDRRVEIPATEGVIQAALGYLPFSEFKKLLVDDSGSEMLTSIFEDNVRDWQGWKLVNSGIKATLNSDDRSNFVLMNNGVTILTRDLTHVGSKFTITDYQIVNGCQSSNVLFNEREVLDDTVMVPVRLIHTLNARIKELITTATNSQTVIKPEQFASGKAFARGLEQFFATYPAEHRLFYARRDGQFDRGSEPKLRVVDAPTLLRSYAAIFREAPHTATKNYSSIRDQIGGEVFADSHKHEPYYYAAWSWFTLESYFRSKTFDAKYKSARFHLLMTVNLLIDPRPPAQPNSHEIAHRAEAGWRALWDPATALELFAKAKAILDEVTGGNYDRDHVRTEAITNAILAKFRKGNQAEPAKHRSGA